MASKFIQDILDRIETLEGKVPTIDLDRHGHEVVPLEQEVRQLNVSKEYRRRIEDLEARWAVDNLHRTRTLHRTHLSADYVVDTAGHGTHLHLRNAVIDAIASQVDKFIWIKFSVSDSNMDLTGMAPAQNIYIMAGDREQVSITAVSGEDIFVQSGNGGNSTGGLHFRNINFINDAINNLGVYANTGATSEIKNLEFDHCRITEGYFARQTSLNSLGALVLQVYDCVGSADGFYQTTGASGTLAPDQLIALDNRLTLNEWWTNDLNLATPDFTRVFGGSYSLAAQLQIANSTDNTHFHGFKMNYSGANAAFVSDANASGLDDLTWTDIQFQVSNAGGMFCNLGIANNAGNGLYIHGIHGFGINGLTITATPFIEIGDSSHAWNTAFVSDIYAPEWADLFEGNGTSYGDSSAPHALLSTTHSDTLASDVTRGSIMVANSTPAYAEVAVGTDGSLFSSDGTDSTWETDILIAGYLACGTAAPPANTTAGDLSVTRLSLGGQAQALGTATVAFGYFFGKTSEPTGSANTAYLWQHEIEVADAISTTDLRTLTVQNIVNTATDNNLGQLTALRIDNRYRGTAGITAGAIGIDAFGMIMDSASQNFGTVAQAVAIRATAWSRITSNPTGTLTLAAAIKVLNSSALGSGPVVITTQVGVDIDAPTRGTTNFGIRNAGNMVQTGYLRVGGVTAPTNVANGDLTAINAFITGNLEVDGALNHDGTTVGFYGTTPITQAVLATGAGATVDNVITALQNLGLVKQA